MGKTFFFEVISDIFFIKSKGIKSKLLPMNYMKYWIKTIATTYENRKKKQKRTMLNIMLMKIIKLILS